MTVESEWGEDSDSQIGVGVQLGPRLQHASRPFGVEANVGGSVYLGEWDFGLNRDGGRLSYIVNIGLRLSY